YPRPVHLQPAYSTLGYVRGDFPEAEALSADTMSLPMYPELGEPEIAKVCDSLKRAFEISQSEVDDRPTLRNRAL
ncbi:MAG: DegT/DnrJ/EryC1/StrS family aminotransferase, partial [Hansschlegelia sp.]